MHFDSDLPTHTSYDLNMGFNYLKFSYQNKAFGLYSCLHKKIKIYICFNVGLIINIVSIIIILQAM